MRFPLGFFEDIFQDFLFKMPENGHQKVEKVGNFLDTFDIFREFLIAIRLLAE